MIVMIQGRNLMMEDMIEQSWLHFAATNEFTEKHFPKRNPPRTQGLPPISFN